MASVGFGGRQNHDAVNAYIAHLTGVKAAVHDEGREIQSRAGADFASHDRPGGHEIVGEKQNTDYVVSLVGPAPLVLEFGREGFDQERPDGTTRHVGPMQGLHILGKAARL